MKITLVVSLTVLYLMSVQRLFFLGTVIVAFLTQTYCRMLLHDTLLNDDGYRSGIAETRMCSCGEDNETVEHFLFQCPNYSIDRSVMFDTVNDIWINSKQQKKWRLDITESLLLAPYSDSVCFTKKDNSHIKEALFVFLASVDCHL